jgi:hypothetical protein
MSIKEVTHKATPSCLSDDVLFSFSDSEVLPSLTSEKQMVFCCCMTLHVRKAFLTYENG